MPITQGTIRHRLLTKIDDFDQSRKALFADALALAETIHDGQFRKPPKGEPELKEPYITHPMRVALILFDELGVKEIEALCAAVLHDVVEDSDGKVTTSDLEKRFGRPIALMVSVLTKPAADRKIPREVQLRTYYERVAQSAVPTRLIKLADRLDNMRDALGCGDTKFQQKYLIETREEYLPLAQNTDEFLLGELTVLCDSLEETLVNSAELQP